MRMNGLGSIPSRSPVLVTQTADADWLGEANVL
jgi:hypothetical protein